MKRLILLLPFLALVACSDVNFNEADFVTQISSVSLTVKGTALFEYDRTVHQCAWSEGKMQYRMMDDSLGSFFVVNLGSLPSYMGEVIKAEVLYTLNDEVKSISGSFNVSKIQTSSLGNYIWLWHDSTNTGVVIQELN